MSSRSSRPKTFATAAAVCAAAVGLRLAPAAIERPLRAALVDAIVCSQSFAAAGWRRTASAGGALANADRSEPWASGTDPTDEDQTRQLRLLEARCRRLTLENARLSEELKLAETYGVSPLRVSPQNPLVKTPTAIRASVVNREALAHWRTVRQLESGRVHGVAEMSLVLDSRQPHIDRGSDAGIEPELDVFIGRCVVGRIESVGRWTSTLELVTDPRYRGLAQVVRPSEQGGSFGAEGILVGAGTALCRLEDVPTTQSVRPGDEVYTSDRDGRTPVPLYYGRIVRVQEAGRCWNISVEPAVKGAELKSVTVLKTEPASGQPLAE